ncbi:MAG: hypothetical protein ACI4JI_06575 [Ruminiclostridium sp.]
MPHSSGGGSHGGGSHSSSGGSHHSSGGSGGGSKIRTSTTYFPGARRFVYYRNGQPNYVYSNTDLSKPPSKLRFVFLIFYIPFIFAVIMMLSQAFQVPSKLSVDYDPTIVIEDNIGAVSDESALREAMKDFYNETGITPALITDSNSAWKGKYSSLENYAYDLYVNRFYDEKHWLIVFTTDEGADGFNNWYWEGMQGNDTDNIITSSIANSFTSDVQTRLLRNDGDAGKAVTEGFEALTPTVMNARFDGETLMFAIFILVFICIHAFFMVFFRPNANKYKGAKEVPLDIAPAQPANNTVTYKQASCTYCGGTYTVGSCNACPHCGAPIKPEEYTVYKNDGKSNSNNTVTNNPYNKNYVKTNNNSNNPYNNGYGNANNSYNNGYGNSNNNNGNNMM